MWRRWGDCSAYPNPVLRFIPTSAAEHASQYERQVVTIVWHLTPPSPSPPPHGCRTIKPRTSCLQDQRTHINPEKLIMTTWYGPNPIFSIASSTVQNSSSTLGGSTTDTCSSWSSSSSAKEILVERLFETADHLISQHMRNYTRVVSISNSFGSMRACKKFSFGQTLEQNGCQVERCSWQGTRSKSKLDHECVYKVLLWWLAIQSGGCFPS